MSLGPSDPNPELESLPRVLVVIGTRPEAIKMAPVVAALRRRQEELAVEVLLTGQHTELVAPVSELFRLSPRWELAIMREGQSLEEVGSAALEGVLSVVNDWQPELVLVQGDTATVFFSALAAFFGGARVGHVEAGLRSGHKREPFPEELLRRLTGTVADLHFAPTSKARDNLESEGTDPERIWVTGNPVVDALHEIRKRGGEIQDPRLRQVVYGSRKLVLVTAHRRESFGPPLEEVFQAVVRLAQREDVEILYPVHPNPNVMEPAHRILGGCPRVTLAEPLEYLDLVRAMERAHLILTDSGGIQEEAPTFGVPVLVLREVTERPEGIEAGVARLVGTDQERIVAAAGELLDEPARSRIRGGNDGSEVRNPYGDGRAGERIAELVSGLFRGKEPASDNDEGRR